MKQPSQCPDLPRAQRGVSASLNQTTEPASVSAVGRGAGVGAGVGLAASA